MSRSISTVRSILSRQSLSGGEVSRLRFEATVGSLASPPAGKARSQPPTWRLTSCLRRIAGTSAAAQTLAGETQVVAEPAEHGRLFPYARVTFMRPSDDAAGD